MYEIGAAGVVHPRGVVRCAAGTPDDSAKKGEMKPSSQSPGKMKAGSDGERRIAEAEAFLSRIGYTWMRFYGGHGKSLLTTRPERSTSA